MLVKNRLRLLSMLLIAGLIIIGLVAFNSAKTWSDDMQNIGDERIPALLSLSNINAERMAIRAQTLEVLILDKTKSNKEILQEIVNNNPLALKRPEYIIGLGELGSIGIIYSVFVYVKVEDYANLKYSLNEEIKLKFEANGIHIPNTILDTYRIKEG